MSCELKGPLVQSFGRMFFEVDTHIRIHIFFLILNAHDFSILVRMKKSRPKLAMIGKTNSDQK